MKNKKSVSCPFCGRQLNTQQGINSHIQQTHCNTRPDLVPLSMFIPNTPPHVSNSPIPSIDQDNPPLFEGDHCEDTDAYDYFELGSLDGDFPEPSGKEPSGKEPYQFSDQRKLNLYYPWASKGEWEMAQYLLKSSLSLADIDEFLKLELVKRMSLSADLLPPTPQWKYRAIPAQPGFPSKNPLVLYYHDAVECLQHVMRSPLIQDSLNFMPLQIFSNTTKMMRVYESWLSGNRAWSMQSQIPTGATLLGTILSSDKTTISVITGNRVAHPLLISLANIDSEVLSKALNHLFSLLALIPIPRYTNPKREVNGVCENRLYHQSLDIVLEPLKKAASIGIMMTDPVGQMRFCYTPCTSFIVDTPEASLIACVGGGGKTSPFTTATYKDYDNIDVAAHDIASYWQVAQKARTNGVVDPFWRDWPLAEPCEFLTPEPLHHWHKMFFDHDLKWCIEAVGAPELNFCFSLLQPRVGFRRFPDGVSTLKQVTGKTHRDLQRSLIPLIAGAVSSRFLAGLHALTDFRYSGKPPRFNNGTSARIQLALDEFHAYKGEIVDIGARVNPKGQPLDNWHIPKLEFMQSVVPSIAASGPVSQWSTDVTEHAHITQESKVDFRVVEEDTEDVDLSLKMALVAHLTSGSKFGGAKRRKADLFLSIPIHCPKTQMPCYHIMLLHINIYMTIQDVPPSILFEILTLKTLDLNQAAELFHLPDLVGSLKDYMDRFNRRDQDVYCWWEEERWSQLRPSFLA
ncbi:hypothetical protein BT96DRAFT_1006846 [Gymnopus androsaceus JB14]|uniref:C2H2-type domain-containing protein n=1 Tax=Gymnopus androsaceus JB14 TaxID=1447944 RepID=A0A6A4GJ21_9AGAR|nr:hypothetical protein BT96DRAFT_1006846 [Gymnopus androsaceus JB14]